MTVSIIAAYAANRVIGRGNRIPWKLPEDLRRFKRLTMGHHLILGRKTYESIGRPLPGRRIIVLTRRPEFRAHGVAVAGSVEKALHMAKQAGDEEAFIGGGEEIYRQTMGIAGRLYLTLLEEEFEGDTFFPEFDWGEWRVVFEEKHRTPFGYRFVNLERRMRGSRAKSQRPEKKALFGSSNPFLFLTLRSLRLCAKTPQSVLGE